MAPASPPAPDDGVLARLPLQIGTTSTWSAGRAAAALFPGLGCLVGAVAACVAMARDLGSGIKVGLAIGVVGALLVVYAVGHLTRAVHNRASDLLVRREGIAVDGGRLHGVVIPWSALTTPYAQVEATRRGA